MPSGIRAVVEPEREKGREARGEGRGERRRTVFGEYCCVGVEGNKGETGGETIEGKREREGRKIYINKYII